MMLVQKPPSFLTSLPSTHNHHHRRLPSAPVVVHPTRTPGLLSLSMAKPTPSRHPQQPQRTNRTSKSKPVPKPAPAEVQQASEVETPKKAQQPTPGPSPDKHVRGRQQAHSKPAAKDKITRRSISPPPSMQGRRNIARQPSPPIQTTSQAEGPSFANNPKSNLFDPFVVSSDSDSDNNASRPTAAAAAPTAKTTAPMHPTPKLAKPSGKLARRRQPPAPSTPTPASSKAIAVPRPNNGRHTRAHSAMMNVSRSAPITSPIGGMGAFPICDDTTDADGLTPPSTPVRGKGATWQQTLQSFDDGPRTAPLSSTAGFPFGPGGAGLSPTPSSRYQRHHVRSPSEGVFNMSLDEDSSSSDHANEDPKMLFGLKPKRPGQGQNLRGIVQISNAAHPSSSASKAAKAALYASSLFQNSPSPDVLPPPAF